MSFFKIAAKNLGRKKSRTILTVVAIALGTALLAGIVILNDSYLDSYINGVSEQLGYTDLGFKRHLNVSDGYFTINDFENQTNIEDIEGYISSTGRIVNKHICTNFEGISEKYAYETTFFGIDLEGDIGYGYAEILATTTQVQNQLSKEPDSIEQILALNSSYVVITTWVKDVYNFQLGDTILVPHRIDNSTSFDNSNTWERYEVAAIINDLGEGRDVNFDYSKNKTTGSFKTRALYFRISETRKMINLTASKVNLLYVHINLDKIIEIGEEIQETLPAEYYGHNIKEGELESVYDSVQSMQMILIIFTMISFIIAIMLTLNTLMMSVNEQKYEVGVLRAEGIYKKEIFKMFVFEALILSLSGTALGIVLGLILSPILKEMFFSTLMAGATFDLVISIQFTSLLMVFGFTFIISLLIGVLPAILATKIQIIEAIRGISTEKKGKKIKKAILPIIGIILIIIGYIILLRANRRIQITLIGIIPFIFGLIILSTLLIPLLSKGFSYLFAFFLGPFRNVTNQNLKRDPNQTKITFIMFGLAICFLVMVANTLNSMEIVQYNTIPRYLGADIIINSEGSTFGMDEILIPDVDVINGSVENAALLSTIRIKVDDYGTWASDLNDEPKIQLYIIEGGKFIDAITESEMYGEQKGQEKALFRNIDNEVNSTIICKQLVDNDHLNKGVGDKITIDLGIYSFNLSIIGITEFVSGFSETWEEPGEIKPIETKGDYCVWVSWQTIIPLIDLYFENSMPLPEIDFLVKGDDHDFDFWDFPVINRTEFRDKFTQFLQDKEYKDHITIAERIWDENRTAGIANSLYSAFYLWNNQDKVEDVHIAFENTALKGTTTFVNKRHSWFETVQDALENGTYQCVITVDIHNSLGLDIDDNVSIWYYNISKALVRQNFTIAGVINISSTIEAVNFHSQNPYVGGNFDVGSDDSTAVIVDIKSNASYCEKPLYLDLLNTTGVYEFWIKFENSSHYFTHHLKAIRDLQDFFGSEYIFADMRWLFTQKFAYAPKWLIQVDQESGYTQEETLERIKEFLLLNKMPVITWMTVDGLREKYSDQINFQKSFFNIVLSFALLIAILGIMINMLISISNRKREIGMMRAIGIYKKELMKMILGETLILVFSGFLIGTIMGTLSANELLLGLPLDAVFDLKQFIDYSMITFLFGIVILVSIIAAALPVYRVMKLDVIEAIRAV